MASFIWSVTNSDWPKCTYKKENVDCDGYRCPLGRCIPDDRVCDR